MKRLFKYWITFNLLCVDAVTNLPASNYQYSFQFQLPAATNLPISFEGHSNCSIRYMIIAIVKRPGKSNVISKKAFTFLPQRELRIDSLMVKSVYAYLIFKGNTLMLP